MLLIYISFYVKYLCIKVCIIASKNVYSQWRIGVKEKEEFLESSER